MKIIKCRGCENKFEMPDHYNRPIRCEDCDAMLNNKIGFLPEIVKHIQTIPSTLPSDMMAQRGYIQRNNEIIDYLKSFYA